MRSDSLSAGRQPWIHSAFVDSVFIIAPAFLAVGGVILLRDTIGGVDNMPLWVWVSFILCVDVAHVYGTIFRTYCNKAEFEKHRALFTAVPLLAWVAGALLYGVDRLLFWRVLAYVAVFHFIRQQYGFMMFYAREENDSDKLKRVDRFFIYACTIYPVVYWHAHLPRNFHWFVDGDFVSGLPELFEKIALLGFILASAVYLFKEFKLFKETKRVNIPKNAFALGTALSWNTGIVLFDDDIIFTVANVVSHGLPYIAFIWIYGNKQADRSPGRMTAFGFRLDAVFRPGLIPVYMMILLGLAFIEEGFWSGLVWRERLGFFRMFSALPKIDDSATLAWVVSLLSLPQVTHYVLDGFIWRLREEKAEFKAVLFQVGGHKA